TARRRGEDVGGARRERHPGRAHRALGADLLGDAVLLTRRAKRERHDHREHEAARSNGSEERAMTLRRRHLFEFNDTPGVPDFVRDTIIESLSRTIAWGRVLRDLVRPFTTFVRNAGATEVLDIGA